VTDVPAIPRADLRGDPLGRRVARRLVTIPAVVLGLAMTTAALPALVTLALAVDLARPAGRRALSSVRVVLFLEAFLLAESLGVALLGLIWIATIGRPRRREDLTWPVQRFYTGMQMRSVQAIFALRFEVEGADRAAEGGPVVVLCRHASIVDALVPSAFVANRHRIKLRYVLKRELLADPCLDVAGHFLPNHFVARDGSDSEREIDAVRALKAGIGADDGVLIYPEGKRFTEGKRRRALERLEGDPDALARARRLRHLLPIRPGGALALLDAAPACDVIFLGHAGLEGFSSVADIWAGALVGRTVRVRFWREPAASIPEGDAARLAWLAARWQRLDDWLDALEPVPAPAPELVHA
jgi:1-acyl-sn-glycerol-3-phosphate acyltransferase